MYILIMSTFNRFMEKFEDMQKGNQKLKIKEGQTTQKSMKNEKQRSTKHYSVN